MAGFGNPTQALYTTVRELVENSLDSCEEAKVFPKIKIQIQGDTLRISDKSRDALQEVIAFLKGLDFEAPLSFTNYR